jgi:hypothetical protein
MQARVAFRATLLVTAMGMGCATPPAESPGPNLGSGLGNGTPVPSPPTKPALETAPEAPPAPQAAADAAPGDACAEESETVPVVIATQHARGKRPGFVVKMQAPLLKMNETLIDTSAIKGGYNCCVSTEVEAVRFECELADGPSIGHVHREKDELVIDPGEGHESRRLPIPCGAWLRFRGPVKECESSPPLNLR